MKAFIRMSKFPLNLIGEKLKLLYGFTNNIICIYFSGIYFLFSEKASLNVRNYEKIPN